MRVCAGTRACGCPEGTVSEGGVGGGETVDCGTMRMAECDDRLYEAQNEYSW